ncbi:thyroid adenoma-associated protein homolog isoform X2 [Penaeus japonicus]|nr:thyroid adenoma-associated protein homolog isoform X2 [Penaeus japonicus]
MDNIIQEAVAKLFAEDVNQKIVRRISKDLENLKPCDQELLVEKISYNFRKLMDDDPVKALVTATLLSDGNYILKKGLSQCIEEILKVCCGKIDSLHVAESRKQSEFHIAVKAVYGIFQYVLPLETELLKDLALQQQLKTVRLSLLRVLVSNKLPSDCSLIVSTSLCITSALLCTGDMEVNFLSLINAVSQAETLKGNFQDKDWSCWDVMIKEVAEFCQEITPSLPVVLIFHGLFNSNAAWLYLSSNRGSGSERNIPFLYNVHPIVMKMCKSAASYTFQAFQVLHIWIACVRKYGNLLKEALCDKGEKTGCCLEQEHPASWPMFTLQADDSNTVFHLLNSNWENPAKGVSDVVYLCMSELLELHDDKQPGQAKVLASNMLDALVTSAAWTSKSTYPPLGLAISFVGAHEALQLHPILPTGLTQSLKVNHLASAGTNVYKIVLSQLSVHAWRQHFLHTICDGLHSQERMIQQHILTLWLPPTLRQYGNVYHELITMCQDCSSGWLARMAILRVARSIGILNLQDNFDEETEIKERQEATGSSNEITAESIIGCVEFALCYIDEVVRGEALAFLCCTQKGSQPVSSKESELLREFFKWNMNIDSAPFRQSIIKCYKSLVTRLRDTCHAELKKAGYKSRDSEGPLRYALLEELPVLKVNCELLIWFVHFLHENLTPEGNYQRRILSLQLYRETLLAFYDSTKLGKYLVNARCATVSGFINSISADEVTHKIVDLTLPWTQEMLLSSCMDEMNDVREEAEWTLKILECSENSLCYSDAQLWLMRGLSMCDSPKASSAESGATLVKVVTSACLASGHNITNMLKSEDSQSLLTFLFCRVKSQFEAAQDNLLEASQKGPIHGSLMALGYCLCRDALTTEMSKEDVQEFMTNLTDLLIDIIEYMLAKLACASPNGSAFAPSFAEMGESIEMIIKECEDKGVQERPYCEEHFQYQQNVEVTVEEEEEVDIEDNAISGNHQLILACCWQTMKSCCAVTSMSVTHWIGCLRESLVEKLLHGVVVRVLTATRHKGAMEAARASYGQLCSVLLSSNSNLGHLIYKQVKQVLDHLESGAQTSVTRRAAGIAMMMQVACGAAPRTNVDLINTTVLRLIHISQLEYEEQSTVDASPVLALHMLQSLVLHAPLAHHLLLHLPAITGTCLQAFTNHSWALRNAALQLYGAVVPRMVGQKKVRDDSSVLNSLTAPEFLTRHPSLAQSLLKMLLESGVLERETLQNEEKSSESEIEEKNSNIKATNEFGDSMSIKVSSSLVPVLSLLARLSPGTGLQQNAEMSNILQCYRNETTRLLESPIHTVRRLASHAIVALTPLEEVLQLIHNHVQLLQEQDKITSNQTHGSLLTLMNILTSYPNIQNNSKVKEDITTALLGLTKLENRCFVNVVLSMRICQLLKTDVNLGEPVALHHAHPGVAEYVQLLSKTKMKELSGNEMKKYLTSCISKDNDMEEICFDYLQDNIRQYKSSPWLIDIEKLLWGKLEQHTTVQWNPVLKTLHSIVREQGYVTHTPTKDSLKSILHLLKEHHGVRVAAQTLMVVSYLFKCIDCNQWPDTEIRTDILIAFSSLVNTYATPTSTEDYRLAASDALKVALRTLLFSQPKLQPLCCERLVFACVELLQDEDSTIRDSACHIVESLRENRNDLQSENVHLLHPNLALREFFGLLASWSVSRRDWDLLRILWRISSNQQLTPAKSGSNGENPVKPKSYLFQSHTMNLYKEPKHLSIITSELLLKALKDHKGSVQYEGCVWLTEECQHLNRQGFILHSQLSSSPVLALQKELLVAVSTYILACKTLLQISNFFNVHLDLAFPVSWDCSKFCAVDFKKL